MERFLAKIVSLMKEENLFATQGGPIILAQVIKYCAWRLGIDIDLKV